MNAFRHKPSNGALAPMVRPLPDADTVRGNGWTTFALEPQLRLLIAGAGIDREEWLGITTEVIGDAAAMMSRSAAGASRAVLYVTEGRVGLDLETLERVALNATADDAWLANAERVLVEASAQAVLELGCHWVLKEAYGKALGVGLALPLDGLTFQSRNGAITLEGAGAPSCREGWQFGLYRYTNLLIAVAYQPPVQAATPLAPAGRKPPILLLER